MQLLLFGEHFLLAAVAGQKLLAPDFPLAQVKVVVAAVRGDRAVVTSMMRVTTRFMNSAGHGWSSEARP